MLTCRELAQEYSSAYIDNELTSRQYAGMRLHILLCGHCRRFVKQLRLVKKVLQQKPQFAEGQQAPLPHNLQAISAQLQAFQREQKKSSPPM